MRRRTKDLEFDPKHAPRISFESTLIAQSRRFECWTDQWRMHGFGKPLGLSRDFVLFIPGKGSKLVILGPNQDGDCSLPGEDTDIVSPSLSTETTRTPREWAALTLLNPLACLYHSLILFNVDLRVRSNMNRMATASFETRGSIETNSR